MTALLEGAVGWTFELGPEHEAAEPPEARGTPRDEVRLMVSTRADGGLVHARFRELGRFLEAGDLVVVNTSATIPAALPARARDGAPLTLHWSGPLPGGMSLVELRDGMRPFGGGAAGDALDLPGGASVRLAGRYGPSRRLWIALIEPGPDGPGWLEWLHRFGAPIQYGHVRGRWPLSAYQTVFGTTPGSAEMPGAARPFTADLVTRLAAHGVDFAPLLLHAGVSSLEAHEAPYPERFLVPRTTADRINHARRTGGRVIAAGTTVVRAIETVADDRGVVHPGEGWTETVVTPERGVRATDGLITGWHEPEATHLAMLEAIGGLSLLEASYAAALAGGYLWHEFGDSHLILP